MKYCSKCGNEVAEGVKFCKNCGAAVKSTAVEETKKQVVSVNKKSSGKSPVMKLALGLVVVILCIGVLSKLAGSMAVPAYEKPLKTQIEAIKKNDVDKFMQSFSIAGKDYYEDRYTKEAFKEIKKISYEVVDTSELSAISVLDVLGVLGLSAGDVEEAKMLEVELKYEDADGETGSHSTGFVVAKMNGKWYAVDSILE